MVNPYPNTPGSPHLESITTKQSTNRDANRKKRRKRVKRKEGGKESTYYARRSWCLLRWKRTRMWGMVPLALRLAPSIIFTQVLLNILPRGTQDLHDCYASCRAWLRKSQLIWSRGTLTILQVFIFNFILSVACGFYIFVLGAFLECLSTGFLFVLNLFVFLFEKRKKNVYTIFSM